MNQHQPITHTISRTLKRLRVGQSVGDGSQFFANRDLRIDFVVPAAEAHHAPKVGYRHKGLLVDGTFQTPESR